MRSALAVRVFAAALCALPAAVAASSPPPAVPLQLCNGWHQIFKVSVDGGPFFVLKTGACAVLRVRPGSHVIVPRPEIFSRDWLAHEAWVVEAPLQGAVVRFGERDAALDIVTVERGRKEHALPASHVPRAGEPLFLTSARGVPVPSWYQCWWPLSQADVLFDRQTPLLLSPGYWGTFITGVGSRGLLGAYDLSGDPVCAPFAPAGEWLRGTLLPRERWVRRGPMTRSLAQTRLLVRPVSLAGARAVIGRIGGLRRATPRAGFSGGPRARIPQSR